MSNKDVTNIEILYQDSSCVVVNKPANLMVHPDGKTPGPFLTDWVIKHFPQAATVGEPITTLNGEVIHRPGIVHRLDRETSGAIIIALTQESYEDLKKQFQDRTISKKYLTWVWGEIKEEFGIITRPIGRNGSDFRKWSAQRGARGEMRPAETYWTRIWTGHGPGDSVDKFSLIQAEPKTGRTHQIRVHLNAIHHPVVSDKLYAPKRPFALGFTRNALHSYIVKFTNMEGKMVQVTAPLPADFLQICTELNVKV